MKWIIAIVMLTAAGCASPPPAPQPTIYAVPDPQIITITIAAPIPCIDTPPNPPNTATPPKNATIAQRAAAIVSELLHLRNFAKTASALLKNCAQP